MIKNELLTNENDGIYKGPVSPRKWNGDESTTASGDSLSNIYSNVNVKIKAAAAIAAAAANHRLASRIESVERTSGSGGGVEDDSTGRDALSNSIGVNLEHKPSRASNSSAIYSMPYFPATPPTKEQTIKTSTQSEEVVGKFANKLCLNESANTFINKTSAAIGGSGRKMSYGIYQVANQVLIDYDDYEDDENNHNTENETMTGTEDNEHDHQTGSRSEQCVKQFDQLMSCSIKSNKRNHLRFILFDQYLVFVITLIDFFRTNGNITNSYYDEC